MKTFPIINRFALAGSIAFSNARLSAIKRTRKQEPSQMQLAFERARAKVA